MPTVHLTLVCPDCYQIYGERDTEAVCISDNELSKGGVLEIACPVCHAKRRAHIAEIEGRYRSAIADGFTAPCRPLVFHRPNSSGRRVIRKSEPMGG